MTAAPLGQIAKKLFNVLVFLFVLEAAFAVHEYGHLSEMRRRDIPVEEFSLGIGPAVYRHQFKDFSLTVRLIPVMAYVKPTENGMLMIEKSSLSTQCVIFSAGVRNNLFLAFGIILVLQLFAIRSGQMPFWMLFVNMLIMSLMFVRIGVYFAADFLTFGRQRFFGQPVVNLGGMPCPEIARKSIELNLLLGFLNILPIFPLDGGKIFFLLADIYLPPGFSELIKVASMLVLLVYLFGGRSSLRVETK